MPPAVRPSSRCRAGLLAVVILVPLLAALGPAPQAVAAAGDPILQQCFSGTALAGCVTSAPAFTGSDVEVSPDGRHVYVLGQLDGHAIRLFDRGADDQLTPRAGVTGCYTTTGAGGCTPAAGFLGSGVFDLAISADGTSVYVAGSFAVVAFARDPGTGALSYVACYGDQVGCTALPGVVVQNLNAVAVTPDGDHVYARGENRLYAFSRNDVTSALSLLPAGACYTEAIASGCTTVNGIGGSGFEMNISSDSGYLYATNRVPGGVAVFEIQADGTLTQEPGDEGGCITFGGTSPGGGVCGAPPGNAGGALQSASGVTISPSGGYVIVTGQKGTSVFARADNGLLTWTDCLSLAAVTGCQQMNASTGLAAEFSPSGSRVVLPSVDVAGFGVYDFDPATGHLSRLPGQAGCYSSNNATGCTPVPGTSPNAKATWAPDGSHFYAVDGPLLTMRQDRAPVCQPLSVLVTQNTPTKIKLSCVDPDGDAVTIGAPAQAGAGLLGAVDQATGTVVYSPFSGYVGPDSFTYTATALGTTSAPATVSVTVQPPDTSVTLKLLTTKLRLNARHKTSVKVACPAAERSGPCTGTLKVKTRGKVPFGGKQKVVTLATAKFSVAAGATKALRPKLADKIVALVTQVAAARKLRLVAKVADTVGNKATVRKKATLTLP